MASTNYIVATATTFPRSPDDFTIDVSTGGTLTTASAVLEVVFDEAVFTKAEGKTRLILTLQHLIDKLGEPNVTWPLS